jgi:hypothetical protein
LVVKQGSTRTLIPAIVTDINGVSDPMDLMMPGFSDN